MAQSIVAQLLSTAESRHHDAFVRRALATLPRSTTVVELRALFEDHGLQEPFFALTLGEVARAMQPAAAAATPPRRWAQEEEPPPKRRNWIVRSRAEREQVEAKVLSLLAGSDQPLTLARVVEAIGLSTDDVRPALRSLVKNSFVAREGGGAGATYRVP